MTAKPRLGFLGLGWIGQHRLQALLDERACEVAVVADPSPEVRQRVRELAPGAHVVDTLDQLLAYDMDGAVIATPSAMHAAQALRLLDKRIAVFCQKPLGRTAHETATIVDAARKANRLLGCDLSYRHTEAMRRIRNCIVEGELGKLYAADLVFHNAYGPDKPWFRDIRLSGGGCAIDLGTHLIDLALWVTNFPKVRSVSSRLFAKGKALPRKAAEVEDYALVQLELADDVVVRIACSWNLHAGCDAVIEAHFHGSNGGASMRNRNGSFYDFAAERFEGTRCIPLADPPDAWGGRAVVDWARKLGAGAHYETSIEPLVQVAGVLDQVYGR